LIQDAKNRPLSELLDVESKVVYKVPKYQREYTWTNTHWEALFDDLLENDEGYFLGSLICINKSTDALAVQELEIVDGQQRLTTLSLMLAAIHKSLRTRGDSLDDDLRVDLANLRRRLVLRETETIRVHPQIQSNNLDDYRAILFEAGVIARQDAPKYAGNRRIFKAYRYFQNRVNALSDGDSMNTLPLVQLLTKVNRACLVKIEVDSHAAAYTLFESLNNRGLPLTAIDLIKNKLLARLEAIEPGSIDHYFEIWRKLLSDLGDDESVQERFFRHYYNAFKNELNVPFRIENGKKKDPLGLIATKSNLIQIYEKLIDQDANQFVDNIANAGRIYSRVLAANQDENPTVLDKPLRDLSRIQGSGSYLLLLFLLTKQSDLGLEDAQLAQIVDLLVRFFVRRNITDLPPTRDLTRMFMALIDEIADCRGEELVELVRGKLISSTVDDDKFRACLEGPIYDDNSEATRFILCAYAEKGMTRESRKNLWDIDQNKKYIWTIEHIFPQGEDIPEAWVLMMADGDKKKAQELQSTHVHKIGNLTITAYNSTLGSKSFDQKRDRTDRDGNPIGYRNGLNLNADLARANNWSIEQIDVRTTSLVDEVIEMFKLDRS